LPTESQYDFVMRTHEKHFRRQRRELSKLSGISLDTLNKIFQRQTKNPKASTVQAIYDVLVVCEQEAAGVPTGDLSTVTLEPVCV
jgi:transcriptional regulator with XRE-family HTH domain